MIDTHCHVLPGLDDGARSLAESIQMVRRLEEGGVRHVVCTPHFSRRFRTDIESVRRAREQLAGALAQLGIEVSLSGGAEIDPVLALRAPIEQLRARSVAPGYVLVEALPDTPAQALERIAIRLAQGSLAAVLAHPERCAAVQQQPALVDTMREHGALVQVVASSLTGSAGAAVGRTAWRMIEDGRADLVASDAHRPESSRLRLAALAEVVAARAGVETARALFEERPRRLLASQLADSYSET